MQSEHRPQMRRTCLGPFFIPVERGFIVRFVLLLAIWIFLLTACTVASPQPVPTLASTPTAITTPTPTPEWGVAFAALHPLMVGDPTEGGPLLSLYYIHRDGGGLTLLTDWMYHLTNLRASSGGEYLLFSAKREDTSGDYHIGWPDLSHLYIVEVQSREVFTLTSGTDFSEERGGAWSPDGQRIAFVALKENVSSTGELHYHLCMINRDGTGKECLLERDSIIWTVAWSPTGEQVLFEQNGSIWVVNPDGSGLLKVVDAPIEHWRPYTAQPVWSPNGRRIAFAAPGVGEENNADIFVINADGSGMFNLTRHPAEDIQPAWSPDGRYITFVSTREGHWGIYAVEVEGGALLPVFYNPDAGAYLPTWSPDGSQIAFVVGNSGIWKEQLFITDWPAGSPRQLGKEYIGDRPAWVLMPSH